MFNTSASRNRRASLVAALVLGLAVAPVSGDAEAQGKPPAAPPAKGKPGKPAPPPTKPAAAKKPVAVSPAAISWGMSPGQVASVYEKLIEEDFKPKYKKVQPGPSMIALDAQLAEAKAEVRRSLVKFGDVPTGYDATPLKPEYTYGNKEAVMNVTRDGRERYFFFIQDKLWKVVDEHPLGEGKPWGKTFDEALGKLGAYYQVGARVREPDATNGLAAKEGDWSDGKGHVRAVDRGETSFALIFEDEATLANLASLRTNKARDPNAMDASVSAILRDKAPPPGPPPDAGKDGKKGQKPPPAPPPKK
jgi:hypothetical protein